MNTMRVLRNGKIEVLDEQGEVVDVLDDRVFGYMLSKAIPTTVNNYLTLSYFGEVQSPEELEGEQRAEYDSIAEYLVDSDKVN